MITISVFRTARSQVLGNAALCDPVANTMISIALIDKNRKVLRETVYMFTAIKVTFPNNRTCVSIHYTIFYKGEGVPMWPNTEIGLFSQQNSKVGRTSENRNIVGLKNFAF